MVLPLQIAAASAVYCDSILVGLQHSVVSSIFSIVSVCKLSIVPWLIEY